MTLGSLLLPRLGPWPQYLYCTSTVLSFELQASGCGGHVAAVLACHAGTGHQ